MNLRIPSEVLNSFRYTLGLSWINEMVGPRILGKTRDISSIAGYHIASIISGRTNDSKSDKGYLSNKAYRVGQRISGWANITSDKRYQAGLGIAVRI